MSILLKLITTLRRNSELSGHYGAFSQTIHRRHGHMRGKCRAFSFDPLIVF